MTNKHEGGKMDNIKSLASSFFLEAERNGRGMAINMGGIIGISDYSDDYVRLKSHAGYILIKGSRISLTVFDGGCIEVVGRIEGIEFKYGKN